MVADDDASALIYAVWLLSRPEFLLNESIAWRTPSMEMLVTSVDQLFTEGSRYSDLLVASRPSWKAKVTTSSVMSSNSVRLLQQAITAAVRRPVQIPSMAGSEVELSSARG